MKPDKINVSMTLLGTLALIAWITSCTHNANFSDLPEICFEGDVLPIFQNSCAISGCHDGQGRGESHLVLNNYADIMNGISARNPGASSIYQSIISKGGEGMMPPAQPLSLDNRTIIRVWIEQGAQETLCQTATGPVNTSSGTGKDAYYNPRACFERDILPVLVSRCATTSCHDATSRKEGYNFTSYASTITAVRAGSPANSKLFQVIANRSGEDKMPPSGRPQLTTAEIDSIGKWIGYGALNENCGEICDTINPVTFSGTIWPVIQSTCTGCHSGASPSGNVLLESYNNVSVIASNGILLNALKGAGVTRMPPSGSLSACKIRQFEMWVNSGFPNN